MKWGDFIYQVRELNAKEYLGIEGIVRKAKDYSADAPLAMEPGDFSIGLIVASVVKTKEGNDDWEGLVWEEVAEMPAKLFQALSNKTNALNVLSPKEEHSLFFESSMEGKR